MGTTKAGEISGVVAGYDGSETAGQALDWAAAEARARGASMTVVYVWEFDFGASMGMPALAPETLAERTLEAGLERVRRSAPGLEARPVLERGSAGASLVEISHRADLMVVGSRGRGGFAGLVLGSVGAQLAAHARCPVVVVRGEGEPAPEGTGTLVVGVDGSPASRAAVELAFGEADVHRVPLRAIVAWTPEVDVRQLPLVDGEAMREAAERRLDRLLAPVRERYPRVDVQCRVEAGSPREVLMDASDGARLLVVGARGTGGIRGLLLGSVSDALVHHAPCPVAVARAEGDTGA
ncbi:universal stress protein [Actinomadura sp. NBRC 104412]|uniref:universal stress protein n=1 Tax=Actinomadura sp. NBRC 104412 TaxID=3032203 RepID=UPI0024A2652E|nr:universal stress protein [Actinomadura sp. NBRC 104412]GLZ09339.1 universal stress protein [Actinomadura sp. NBRC 104412]